ncbi:MAG: diguanylate cyclase, partial [Candidatus Izemoplasma sp.]
NCEVITDETNTPIDLKVLYVNEKIIDFLHLEKQAFVGKTVLDLLPNIDKTLIELYGNIGLTMKPHRQVHYLDFDSNNNPAGYRDIHGLSVIKGQVILTFINVTDTINAQKETEDKILRHSMVLETAQIGFFELDMKSKELYVDKFVNDLFGIELNYDNNHTEFRKRIHHLDYDRIVDLNDKVISGEAEKANHSFRFLNTKTDKYVWIRQLLMVAERKDGKAIRLLGLFTNVDKEKKQEERDNEVNFLLKETTKIAKVARLLYYPKIKSFEKSEELGNFLGLKGVISIDDYRNIIHPDDLEKYDKATEYIITHPQGIVTDYRIINNGAIRYIQSSVYAQTDEYGDITKVFGILKDNTDLEESKLILENHRHAFEQIFNSSPAGIFILNDKFKINMVNKTYPKILGIDKLEIVSLKRLLGKDYHPILKDLKLNGKAVNYQIEYSNKDIIKFFNLNIVKIDDRFRNSYQGTMIDITREVEITDQINYMANHDVLTGLYNRNYFEDYISKDSKVYPSGLIICDIDGLKVINDAFGHLNGDQLLISFSDILKNIFNEHMVARVGGDEFCIIVQNTTFDELEKYERKIKEAISELELYGLDFDVSVGYSLIENTETSFLDAYVKSENIMYRRKLTERSSRKSKALDTIMATLNEKTEETIEHCNRIGEHSELLLREIGYSRQIDIEEIKLLARIHDIGKIIVSESILSKPSILSKLEKEKIKLHSESGYKIAKSILDSENIALGILYHHERIDGKGYPHNLPGDKIPMFARIIAITDAYDAMVSDRSYKTKLTKEEAIKELVDNSGTQFDAEYVKLFIKVLKKA